MSISFAIIGQKKSENTKDLCKNISQKGYLCQVYSINEIGLDTQDETKNSFFSHDIYIFRGYNKSLFWAHALATLLENKNKIIIDSLLTKSVVKTKLEEVSTLKINNIPHPRTYYAQSAQAWKTVLQHTEFPIIYKRIDGQQGQDIYKFDDKDSLFAFITNNYKGFLAQEYIESNGDIRVFIVGNTVLGAIKRFVVENDFRSNASLGSQTEIYNLTDKETDLALNAHNSIGYDISGVDIIFDKDNNPFVLEINHTPQWQAFKKTTGINPAEEIINFALQKYEEKNRVL